LLLEQYDALAAAIGSALKKFAPNHVVSVARSLAQAEAIAETAPPALFIIDVDPVWPGLTDSVERWRSLNPHARVLILGAEISKEIAESRGSFGAFQFIGKPFELADFGAAVQALLGPWREPESDSSRGTLGDLDLLDIILLHCAAGASLVVEVEAARRRYGQIHFFQGHVSHAETGKFVDAAALQQMCAWPEARLSEAEKALAPKRTIHEPWATIALDLHQRIKAASATAISEEKPPRPEPAPAITKKIVVIDDTEMLLIFVEDVLATEHPDWQITKASSGTIGCKEVARVLPDLVLLDYSLPDFNGDEVCRRLLQEPDTAHVPILMMSGHVAEMKATAARFENVVATIEKPFLSEALIELVERPLDRSHDKADVSPAPPALEPPAPVPPPTSVPPPKPVAPPPPVAAAKAEPPKPVVPPPLPSAQPLPAATSSLGPVEPGMLRSTAVAKPLVTPVVSSSTEAVLGLFLDVLSLQFTSQLQMGTIRAKPSSFTVSLHLPSGARESMPVETGFELGPTRLDTNGHIASMRLVPTLRPFQPGKTRSAFEIGDVAVVEAEKRGRVQLTPTMTAPMTMQLLAHLELGGVELTPSFQVAQVVLKWPSSRVRVTLSARAAAGESQGAAFEVTFVQLDPSGRISELTLNPIR